MVAAGQIVRASDFFTDGLPDLQTSTSTIGPTSGTTELALLTSATVALDGNTKIEVKFEAARMDSSVGADVFTFNVKDNGVVMRTVRYLTPGASANSGFNFSWITDSPPSAGNHAFAVTVQRSGGSGTLTVNGSATNLIQLSVKAFR